MSRYVPLTRSDAREMLEAIGVDEIDDLFADIPADLRLDGPPAIESVGSEQEALTELSALADRNVSTLDEVSFLGAGSYDHYIPAVVESLISRSEYLTPYTPYQPEVSQGNLQVMFEYQSAICELTGMDVSNAGVYDGPSAAGAAAYLAKLATGRRELLVSRGLDPQSREVLETMAAGYGMDVVEVGLDEGRTDLWELAALVGPDTAAVFLQQPNFVGVIEDLDALGDVVRSSGALFVLACDPLTLGVLRPPGEYLADVAIGDGQSLGNPMSFGGPSFGVFATTQEHLRLLPGRIAGEAVDAEGRRGFVMALQTREQHIRREKATSNICTAQALNALAATVYLSWLGPAGLRELGELLVAKASDARAVLSTIPGVEPMFDGPVMREFAVRVDAPIEQVISRCKADGVNPGYPLGSDYPEYPDGLLVSVTERRSLEDVTRLAQSLSDALHELGSAEPAPMIPVALEHAA
jgi:glycine dehydrogenase subunit 1